MKKATKEAEIYLLQEGALWATIEAAVHNTVVQIFSHVGKFDWCEPYRIEEQFENCGSGFFIDEEGHIVTNIHVIEEAKYIWCQIPAFGRKQFEVLLVGMCPDRDLALLKISNEGLEEIRSLMGGIPFLQCGDSDEMRRADAVLALGYPLGQYHLKSTTGIISGREAIFNSTFFEITAPINPGNSGGPLLNSRGLVIGIVFAMIPTVQNTGYAIPINELKLILNDLKMNRFVFKPYLGIQLLNSSDEKARFLGNPLPSGVYISHVYEGTLFDHAGVQAGDMLYELNGFTINAYGEARTSMSLFDSISLYDLVGRTRMGDQIKAVLYRKGKRIEITSVIDEVKPFAIRKKYPLYEKVSYDTIAGMTVMELAENHLPLLLENNPELICFRRAELCVYPVLIVTNIVPGCRIFQLRSFGPGTIITQVNDENVTTLDEWKKALEKSVLTGFLTFMTDKDVFVVLSLEEILKDEIRLSNAFSYPLSETVKKLQHDKVKKR